MQAFKKISEQTYDAKYDYGNILNHRPELKLLTTNPVDLKKFYTLLSHYEIEVTAYNFWILYCKRAAEKLIADIQKVYHFKGVKNVNSQS